MFLIPEIIRSTSLLILFAGIAGMANASTAQATTLYVDATCGDDAKSGTSPNCADADGPKLTIQNAINAAINTDEIEVAPGTYNEVIDFIGKAITLRSTSPSDPAVVATTIIDGTGLNNSVVKCISGEGADTVLDGFTITGGTGSPCLGSSTCGGGMYNENSSGPTVKHCTFAGNTATNYGGGMCNFNNSSPTVIDCTFIENSSSNGGGMCNFLHSSPALTNCRLGGNGAENYGGGMYNFLYSSSTVTNCTFFGNSAAWGGGGMYSNDSSPNITNCILWGNSPDEIFNAAPGTDDPIVSYCDVQGGLPAGTIDGGGNIDAYPRFVDADGADDVPGNEDDDLRLRAFSLAVDAGNNTAVPHGITTDIDGNPRFVDDPRIDDTGAGTPPMVDMGAFERREAPIFNVTQGTWYASIQEAIDAAVIKDEIVVPIGAYNETIDFIGKAITLRSTNPSDPAVVAATIIDGTGLNDSVVKCISGEGPGTALDGFTITGGSGTACPTSSICGGGMYNSGSSPTVTRCVFTNNSSPSLKGGGMYNSNSSPTVTSCTFRANVAAVAGGMYNFDSSSPAVTRCSFNGNTSIGMYNRQYSSPVVTNCTFSGNFGAGMTNSRYSSPAVMSCTFSGNAASYGGAAMSNSSLSSPTVTNCILWGNGLKAISSSSGSFPRVSFSVVRSGLPEDTHDRGGNIEFDPRFVDADGADDIFGTMDDDLRLRPCSLAVDAGDNSAVPSGITTDFDGNPRFVDDFGIADTGAGTSPIVDMGAFERQEATPLGPIHNTTHGTYHCGIQEAINASLDGDEIVVPIGTYGETIDFISKAITLRSTDPSDEDVVAATIIDGAGLGNSVVRCISGEGADTILDGFIITGGTGGWSLDWSICGGGMFNRGSSPTITNCTFRDNSAESNGGGMYNQESSPAVSNCTFTDNTANASGGGMYNGESNPRITNCSFAGNTADERGGGIANWINSSPAITNCTFSGNTTALFGGGMYSYFHSKPIVTNCTFSGNTGEFGGGVYNRGYTALILTNSILWGNSDSGGYGRVAQISDNVDSNSVVSFSCVQDATARDGVLIAGLGNIDTNPFLVDTQGPDGVPGTGDEDLGLLPRSPCIDSGDNVGAPADIDDLDGDFDTTEPIPVDMLGLERFVDDPCMLDVGRPNPAFSDFGIVDMGAFEYQGDALGDPDGDGVVGCADNCPLHDNPDQADCDGDGLGDYCALELGSVRDCNRNDIPDNCDISSGASADKEGNSIPDECQRVYYVDDDAAINQDGLGWETAFRHLQDALASSSDGDEIRVAGGTYTPDRDERGNVTRGDRYATFWLRSGVSVRGGYRGCPGEDCSGGDPGGRDILLHETILSGDLADDDIPVACWQDSHCNAGGGICANGSCIIKSGIDDNCVHVITSINTDRSAVLNGFTITGGNADEEYPHDSGSGMYNYSHSNPTVSNCIFTGNTSKRNGTMYNLEHSSPTVTNCTFSGNAANAGGGMSNQDRSSPTVTNCSFSENTATAYGGGMCNRFFCRPTISDCSFSRNRADVRGGGMSNLDSSPTVTNCTFTRNWTWTEGGGMYNGGNSDGRNPMLVNCTFTGNWTGIEGGAMQNVASDPVVTNCTFNGNGCLEKGGAMHGYNSVPTITNSKFSGNTAAYGGGIYNSWESSPTLTNCTFSANEAGALVNGSSDNSPTVTHCIFWGDIPYEIYNSTLSAFVSYSNIQRGLPEHAIDGGGNLYTDPLFVRRPRDGGDGWGDDPRTDFIDEGANDFYGDLRLQSGSPCINAGDPAFIPEPGETDLDGHARVLCGRVDMGAYEFGIGDYDCDDVVDLLDFSTWSGCMTEPDGGPYHAGCEAFDFDGDSDIDMTDFAGFQRVLTVRP